jgi:hypothetical protein
MSTQRPRHPRAGIAIGLVLLVGWLGAIVASLATDSSSDVDTRAVPGARSAEQQFARPGAAGPGYRSAAADRGAVR